jgi:hypothetical protein
VRAAFLAFACVLSCSPSEPEAPVLGGWTPGTVLPSLTSGPRGMLDVRGAIHAHSVYSHDACDGVPRDPSTDAIDEVCFEDLRRGLCQARHDFVMLTDHGESFARTEYPEVLLHRPGDTLVERNGAPVASWLACPEGARVLVLAGNESEMMPVGLESHAAETVADREAVYSNATSTSVATLKSHGAAVLLQHTEDWDAQTIVDLGVDGFEMYNLHANSILGAGGVISLISDLAEPELLPHPDLTLLAILNEDARYLDTWAKVLASGAHRVTTIGTDCHRNTFPQQMPDGERIDSYRRMLVWMSNHLLVAPEPDGSWDDSHLKEALLAARLYGVFEVFGYPEGFDFYGLSGGTSVEMGGEGTALELHAIVPRVRDLDPARTQPELRLVLLRASDTGWVPVAESSGDLVHQADTPGAYRVEVRIRPRHLASFMSSYAYLAENEYPWIYSNAIVMTP